MLTTVLLAVVLLLSLPGLAVALACNTGCDPDLFPARHRDLSEAPTVPLPTVLIGGPHA